MRNLRWIPIAATALLACGGAADSSSSSAGSTPTSPGGPSTPSTPRVATVTVGVAGGAATTIAVGGTLTLVATAADSQKNVVAGSAFTWTSSNSAIASVSSSGVVVGGAAGTATISATTQGVTGSIVIVVAAQPSTQASLAIKFPSDSVIVGSFGGASSVTLHITRTNFTGAVTVTTSITGALTATNSTVVTSADSVVIPFSTGGGTCGASTPGGGTISVLASAAGVADQRSAYKVIVPNPSGVIQASLKPDTVVLVAGAASPATLAAQTDSPPVSLGDFGVTGITTGITMTAAPFTETRVASTAYDSSKVSLFATTAIPSGFYSAHVAVTGACSKRSLQDVANFVIRVINNP